MDKMRAFLEAQNLTQREAAARMEITEEHLSRVINGKTPVSNEFVGTFVRVFGYEAARQVLNGDKSEATDVHPN